MGDYQDKRARLIRLTDEPGFMDSICNSLIEGLALTEIAHNFGVSYSGLSRWINADKGRLEAFKDATRFRNEFFAERVREELRAIGTADIRKLYDAEGRLLPVQDWPDEIAKAVASVKVFEEFEGAGQDRIKVGEVREVKKWDKLKALESLGRTIAMFTDKTEVTASESLEALILAQGTKKQDE